MLCGRYDKKKDASGKEIWKRSNLKEDGRERENRDARFRIHDEYGAIQ